VFVVGRSVCMAHGGLTRCATQVWHVESMVVREAPSKLAGSTICSPYQCPSCLPRACACLWWAVPRCSTCHALLGARGACCICCCVLHVLLRAACAPSASQPVVHERLRCHGNVPACFYALTYTWSQRGQGGCLTCMRLRLHARGHGLQEINELCETCEAIFREEPTVLQLHGECWRVQVWVRGSMQSRSWRPRERSCGGKFVWSARLCETRGALRGYGGSGQWRAAVHPRVCTCIMAHVPRAAHVQRPSRFLATSTASSTT